jgi:hypothetical protein
MLDNLETLKIFAFLLLVKERHPRLVSQGRLFCAIPG